MTYRNLLKKISKETNLSYRKIEEVMDCALGIMQETIRTGTPVRLKRFATLKPIRTKARNRYIPGSGQTLKYPPRKTVKLVLANDLKLSLNGAKPENRV